MSATDNPQQVSRGLLIALGVVVGLAGLYALYVFVVSPLLEDDDADITTPITSPEPGVGDAVDPAEPDATPDPDAPPGEEDVEDPLFDTDVVPETFEIFTARDPFQQLVVAVPAADTPSTGTVTDGVADANGGTTTPGTTTPGTTTPGTTTPGTTTPGTTTPDMTAPAPPPSPPAPPGSGSPSEGSAPGTGNGSSGSGGGEVAPPAANVGSTTVGLTDVFIDDDGESRLIVTVNGTVYEVSEGDVFAQRFQVLDIDGACATFLFGDSRFTLCAGESIIK